MPIQPTLASNWSGQWYPGLIAQLMAIAGDGFDDDSNGTRMPNLSSLDLMAVLGLVTPSVASAIARFNTQFNGGAGTGVDGVASNGDAARSDYVTAAGYLDSGLSGLDTAPTVDAATYLTYTPIPFQESGMNSGEPWKRFVTGSNDPLDSLQSYEPYLRYDGNEATLNFVRQMVVDWQSMVSAAASAIFTNSTDATQPAPQSDMVEFLSSLRSLCSDLDVLNESPPQSGNIAEAIRYAMGKTSEFVGEAAAEISNEVGKQAGIIGAGLTGGFLQNAGVLSIIVVGILVHLFLR